MQLYGAAAGAVNMASDRATSSIGANHLAAALVANADWRDATDRDDDYRSEHRPLGAARGIVVGILISIPIWALFTLVAYLLV